ncbi:PaaX family transcriptional regulator [Pseudonocardia acaciae]|uniref:PaaX family transcriptional regulator n=1 Tax=Pseudonocardia acaciae TaxID=551276 RepID=UPI00048A7D48|nr:PaaX family transcriptional regulator C-terminal domain-containing protein [Pseudonocardia acaciae]
MTTETVSGDEADTARRSTQPRQLIVTVYGLYSRESGGWLSVASLVSLLAELGVDEPAVRSSISRIKRRGILQARKEGGAAGYELSAEAVEILREGDERIFRRERATLGDGWVLAVFSVPESERHRRHVLRTQLTALGFGTAAPGVWVAPAHLRAATTSMLRRYDLDAYAEVFHAEHLAFGDLTDKIARWWDLDELHRLYEEFLGEHRAKLTRWTRPDERPDERDAFVDYVRVLTDWRRLPYCDPGLPAELLPPDWAGARAADLFFSLKTRLEARAHAYVSAGHRP